MQNSKVIAASTLLALSCVTQAGTVSTDGADLILNTKGGLSLKTSDDAFSFKLGGRIQWDYDYTEKNDQVITDDMALRRARIYTSGNVNDWAYKAQFNLGNGNGGTPEDVYIRYTGWGKKAQLTVGKQKEPFGLEALTSSKYISVLERSAVTEAYAPGRNEGVQFSGVDGAFTYAVGVFEDDYTNAASLPKNGMAVTARATFNPIKTDALMVHFGLAVSDRANDVERFGLELAATAGAFHFQSEYMESDNAGVDADAYYLQAGWFITGETRPYKKGAFSGVKPASASGAWELVARYEDGAAKYKDVGLSTTEGSGWGLAVNWYANKNIRLGASYMAGEEDATASDGNEFRLRLQAAY